MILLHGSIFQLSCIAIIAANFMFCAIGISLFHTSFHSRGSCLMTETMPLRIKNAREIDPRDWLMKENMAGTGSIPCKWITVDGMPVPLCTYKPNEDLHISSVVQSGSLFEQPTVERVVRLLKKSPNDMQLVDIGANVGSFTLPVSRVAPVIAVEPNWETMSRLVTSVVLANVDQNVTLLYSAVSNTRTTLNMAFDPSNRGHTVMTKNASCGVDDTAGLRCLQRPVETILLNDLLPLMKYRRAVIKADVEGHEVNVFTEESAGAFFERIDVPFVIMEWMHNVPLSQNNPEFTELVEKLLSFFRKRGYTFFDTGDNKLGDNWRQWKTDVHIKKSNFSTIQF